MKHKVSELDGLLLDAAVTKAEGCLPDRGWFGMKGQCFEYSKDWSDAGLIIERERIWLGYCGDHAADTPWPGMWFAQYGEDAQNFHQVGATPLVAAMRAYVASKFGYEIELPL